MDEKGRSGNRNWNFSDQSATVSSVLKPIPKAGVHGGTSLDGSNGVSEHQAAFLKMSAFSERNSMISEAAEFTDWIHRRNYLSETKATTNAMQANEADLTDIHMALGASVDATQNSKFETKSTELRKLQHSAKKSNGFASKVLRPQQSKKKPSPSTKRQGILVASVKHDKKNVNMVVNETLDFSHVPTPICSCTGVPRRCYRWGAGGWQSSCCTISISEFPLPMSLSRPTARMAGRKMSNGAFLKLLERLAAEGHNLSNPVDLKNHWARHGTNKFVTIK